MYTYVHVQYTRYMYLYTTLYSVKYRQTVCMKLKIDDLKTRHFVHFH